MAGESDVMKGDQGGTRACKDLIHIHSLREPSRHAMTRSNLYVDRNTHSIQQVQGKANVRSVRSFIDERIINRLDTSSIVCGASSFWEMTSSSISMNPQRNQNPRYRVAGKPDSTR